MQLILDSSRLGTMLATPGALSQGWLAFLDCSERDFMSHHFGDGDNAALGAATSEGRIMFRPEHLSRPDPRAFEMFLADNGLGRISWSDYAEMPQYHRAEAAAVIERAQDDGEFSDVQVDGN